MNAVILRWNWSYDVYSLICPSERLQPGGFFVNSKNIVWHLITNLVVKSTIDKSTDQRHLTSFLYLIRLGMISAPRRFFLFSS